jgi:hypothetical protein
MQQAYDCPPLTVLTHAVPRGNYVQNGAALLSFLNGLFSKLLFGDPMSMELVNISSDLALALILVRTHNVTPLPPPSVLCWSGTRGRSTTEVGEWGLRQGLLHVGWLAGSQCYGEAFNSLASGIISARPAEEQVRTRLFSPHPPART